MASSAFSVGAGPDGTGLVAVGRRVVGVPHAASARATTGNLAIPTALGCYPAFTAFAMAACRAAGSSVPMRKRLPL